MRQRTKYKIKFYLTLVGLLGYSVVVGVFFAYLASMAWQMQMKYMPPRYDLFWTLAIILFIMFVADIILFFHFIMKRRYW
jgi:hypothetical protein